MQSDSIAIRFAQFLSIGAIRLSLLLFVIVCCCEALGVSRRGRGLRILWLLGAIAAITHSLGALIGYHGGSQVDAIRATSEQTKAVLGIAVGYGLFVNYLFLIVWLLDAVHPFSAKRSIPSVLIPRLFGRTVPWSFIVLAFLAFIFFNGTVVFKDGWLRVTGIASSVVILGCYLYRESLRGWCHSP